MIGDNEGFSYMIKQRFKDITSVKYVEADNFNRMPKKVGEKTRISFSTKGIIKLKVNELEYVADVLIYGDTIKHLIRDYSNYQITVEWI